MQRTKAEMSTVCYLKKRIRKNTLQLPPPSRNNRGVEQTGDRTGTFPYLILVLNWKTRRQKEKKEFVLDDQTDKSEFSSFSYYDFITSKKKKGRDKLKFGRLAIVLLRKKNEKTNYFLQ